MQRWLLFPAGILNFDCYDLTGSFSIHAGYLSQVEAGENGSSWLCFWGLRYSSLLMSLYLLTVISTENPSIVSIPPGPAQSPKHTLFSQTIWPSFPKPSPPPLHYSNTRNIYNTMLVTYILDSFLGIFQWAVSICWDTLQVEGGWWALMRTMGLLVDKRNTAWPKS